MSWEGFSGARVLALPGDVSYALSHGVYLSDKQVHTLLGLFWLRAAHWGFMAVRLICLPGSRTRYYLQGNGRAARASSDA